MTNSPSPKLEAIHEREQVQWRKMQMWFLFPCVSELLKSWTKHDLLVKAKEICQSSKIPRPDRLCQRHREALLCWYAFNCRFWRKADFEGPHGPADEDVPTQQAPADEDAAIQQSAATDVAIQQSSDDDHISSQHDFLADFAEYDDCLDYDGEL
jgi:hypothetical protein